MSHLRRMAAAVTAVARRIEALSVKSVNEVLRQYQDGLENLIVSAANGSIKTAGFRTRHNTLIDELAQQAYYEGMREGGIKNPEEDADEDDAAAISAWIADQLSYVLDFARDAVDVSALEGDEKTAARDAMLARVENWVNALRTLGQAGYLSAKGNIPLTFDGDDGEESCDECQSYKGQRHRADWWKKRGLLGRPNNAFSCGRYKHCHHHFYDDDGNVVMD